MLLQIQRGTFHCFIFVRGAFSDQRWIWSAAKKNPGGLHDLLEIPDDFGCDFSALPCLRRVLHTDHKFPEILHECNCDFSVFVLWKSL